MRERREFIRSVGCAAAAFVLTRPAWGSVAAASIGGAKSAASPLSFAGLEPWKGSRFHVSGDDVSGQWLELDQVLDTSHDPCLEAVSLRFQGPADARLAERTYRFSRPGWGRFDLFLKPGTVEGNRCSYRVVICRMARV